jgi:hypothetical protein
LGALPVKKKKRIGCFQNKHTLSRGLEFETLFLMGIFQTRCLLTKTGDEGFRFQAKKKSANFDAGIAVESDLRPDIGYSSTKGSTDDVQDEARVWFGGCKEKAARRSICGSHAAICTRVSASRDILLEAGSADRLVWGSADLMCYDEHYF